MSTGSVSLRVGWNRTTDTEEYIFEVFTRTAQILADSIAEPQFTTVEDALTHV